ncbi:hypothetical protein [Peribacillus sp. ACCC06369]|uniref:hypothetical protein n=1 Tax=Peribacillus sp. ACCC06369 TaxID=3055860 RepID=UPI0025A30E0A|nr:hypothetical protein [Peribacillus sp. ACCC06369]MDM5359698.1 hypothetical protein [Peribacillus sp. ACCC06369]
MTERLSIGIIISCVAVVMGILIDLGELYIAFILFVICVLAALPAQWFRDWLWKD